MRHLTGCLAVALVCGCALIVPDKPVTPVEAVTVAQEGTATTIGLGEQTVYYPVPFLSPPSLELTPTDSRTMIMGLEQKADRFVVTVVTTGIGQPGGTLKWKARGPVPKALAPSTTGGNSVFATTEPSK